MRRLSAPSVHAIVLLAAALLGGCALTRAPAVEVAEAAVTEESDEAIAMQIALELSNPNAEPLELLEARYHVRVDGRRAYGGRWSAEATVSGSGAQRITIPAVVRFDEFGWTPADRPETARWSVRGSLLYVEPGEVAELLLDAGLRRPTVGFSGEGRVELAGSAASE